MGWVLLKSGTFGGNSSDPDTVGVSTGDWSTTSAGNPDFLHIILNTADNNDNNNYEFMFNGDHTSKYTDGTVGNDGSPDGTQGGRSDSRLASSTMNSKNFVTLDIINKTGHPKIVMSHFSDNLNSKGDGHSKYAVSAKALSLQLLSEGSSQAILAGGTYAVYGATDNTTTYTYPNLTNGTLFEESDTGKIYMWDGTNTWNEVI
tara:strand:- start:2033 stop:2641 length:609 start_codon:yes stop_codon:yes gene_type:complete